MKLKLSDLLSHPEENIDTIEKLLIKANDAAREGSPIMEDSVYDRLYEFLRLYRPESVVVTTLWDDEDLGELTDLDIHLKQHPMRSILTIKSLDNSDMKFFYESVKDKVDEFFFSYKLNGHGVRVIYKDGNFIKAHSRARSSNGRDLTKQLTEILRKKDLLFIDELQYLGLVEFRGEVVLPEVLLDEARKFRSGIVSSFTGVSSLLKDSGSEDGYRLLDFVGYNMITTDVDSGDSIIDWESKEAMYNAIGSYGFTIPKFSVMVLNMDNKEAFIDSVERVVDMFTEDRVTYDYNTDGIVCEVNNMLMFDSLGSNPKYNFGNVALKVGSWSQDQYEGFIQYIKYTPGVDSLTPVAVVSEKPNEAQFRLPDGRIVTGFGAYLEGMAEHGGLTTTFDMDVVNESDLGVLTNSGNRVKNVTLYEVYNVLQNNLKSGSPLKFSYGGEAGVIPVFDSADSVMK